MTSTYDPEPVARDCLILPSRKYDSPPEILRISPGEDILVALDFQHRLAAGDQVAEVLSVVTTNADAITVEATEIDGTQAKVRAREATSGKDYLVRVEVRTSFNRVRVGEYLLRCA